MRPARALLLIAIVFILAAVGFTYREQKARVARDAPAAPKALPNNISSKADNWEWSKTEGSRTVVHVRAKTFQQIADTSKFLLEGVDLQFFHKDGKAYDQVKS